MYSAISLCRTLELHVLTPDAWFSDGIAYPRLPWLSADLLPKLVRWATECKSSEFRSTLSLLPVEKYSLVYQQLKEKYKAMVKVEREDTLRLNLCSFIFWMNLCFSSCFCSLGLAWGDGSWEVCLWGCCHCYISPGGFTLTVCYFNTAINHLSGQIKLLYAWSVHWRIMFVHLVKMHVRVKLIYYLSCCQVIQTKLGQWL